jgi:hypothetical protein
MKELSRRHRLAAELFGYSYEHYEDHLAVGNIRFVELMPEEVDALEQAERENWDRQRILDEIDVEEERLDEWIRHFYAAREIVDSRTPIEAFRRGVSYSITMAVEEGLEDASSINRLVTQICYRVADLAYLLEMSGAMLSDFMDELREETEDDRDYWLQSMLGRSKSTSLNGDSAAYR